MANFSGGRLSTPFCWFASSLGLQLSPPSENLSFRYTIFVSIWNYSFPVASRPMTRGWPSALFIGTADGPLKSVSCFTATTLNLSSFALPIGSLLRWTVWEVGCIERTRPVGQRRTLTRGKYHPPFHNQKSSTGRPLGCWPTGGHPCSLSGP